MNAICKPHIVDLLRIFDKRRMVTPRIRYASVRSKPELIADLARQVDRVPAHHLVSAGSKDRVSSEGEAVHL